MASRLSESRSERGGVIVAVVIAATAFALLFSTVIQIGNWYMHRRHLQLQTDAAALAAGQRFALCVSNPTGAFDLMKDVANTFGGFESGAFNLQVGSGGPAAGVVKAPAFNSKTYPIGSTHPVDPDTIPPGPCPTDESDVHLFDVKATETSIPHLFRFLPVLDEVNAHARVELKAINELKGLLPLAVPDVRPKFVFVTFVDEATGTPLGEIELTKGSATGSEQTWVPKAGPISLTIPTARIGVRVRLVGSTDPAAPCGTLYTECYDASDPNLGVVRIRGWSSAGADPALHDVWVLPGTCTPDGYFALDDCSVGIQAQLDLGDRPVSGAGVTVSVTATAGAGSVPLSAGTAVGTLVTWTANSGVAVSGPGRHPVDISWDWTQTSGTWRGFTCSTSGGNKCKGSGTFTNVHSAYVASPETGPLTSVQVYESGVSTSGANSFESGSTHSLGVTLKTTGNLLLSLKTDPPIYLRVFRDSGSASQNQSLDCDRDLPNLKEMLEKGCAPYFIKNPSLVCPTSKSDLWDIWYVDSQPLPCAAIKTGASVGQISQGLNLRIYGTQSPTSAACTFPNGVNWIKNEGFDGDAHPNDKRALPLIVTPLGTFSGTGSDLVPVIDFGYFYVTGYKGDPCEGVDPNQDPVPNNRGAYVRGHFIKFFPLDRAVASDEKCDLSSITPCIGVLTR